MPACFFLQSKALFWIKTEENRQEHTSKLTMAGFLVGTTPYQIYYFFNREHLLSVTMNIREFTVGPEVGQYHKMFISLSLAVNPLVMYILPLNFQAENFARGFSVDATKLHQSFSGL